MPCDMRPIPGTAATANDAGQARCAADARCGPLCLTVDVEEYFHAETFARRVSPLDWPHIQRRAREPLERIADMLDRHDRRATFFVLGWTVRGLKPMLRRLVEAGHEIACHGDRHAHLSRMTPRAMRSDLRRARAKIEDAVGVRPVGYRAPTFSITRRTAWALDLLLEEGFEYDASVFPVRHDRYGVPDAPLTPFEAIAPGGGRILEIPPLTARLGPLRVPVGGGGYLRLLPGGVLRRCIARRRRRGEPAVVYVHPWELDPHQPRLPGGPLSRWRHRVGLRTTERKLERLLQEFDTVTMRDLAHDVCRRGDLPRYAFAPTRAGTAMRLPSPGDRSPTSLTPATDRPPRRPPPAAPRPIRHTAASPTAPAESDRRSGS